MKFRLMAKRSFDFRILKLFQLFQDDSLISYNLTDFSEFYIRIKDMILNSFRTSLIFNNKMKLVFPDILKK